MLGCHACGGRSADLFAGDGCQETALEDQVGFLGSHFFAGGGVQGPAGKGVFQGAGFLHVGGFVVIQLPFLAGLAVDDKVGRVGFHDFMVVRVQLPQFLVVGEDLVAAGGELQFLEVGGEKGVGAIHFLAVDGEHFDFAGHAHGQYLAVRFGGTVVELDHGAAGAGGQNQGAENEGDKAQGQHDLS